MLLPNDLCMPSAHVSLCFSSRNFGATTEKKTNRTQNCALIPVGHKVPSKSTEEHREREMKRKRVRDEKMTKINDLEKLFPTHFSKWHISEFRLLCSPILVTLIMFFSCYSPLQLEHAGQNTWYLLDTSKQRTKKLSHSLAILSVFKHVNFRYIPKSRYILTTLLIFEQRIDAEYYVYVMCTFTRHR